MARYYEHELFKQAVRRDRAKAAEAMRLALEGASGVATAAAEAMGLQYWFFRKWMEILDVGLPRDPNLGKKPSRFEILAALIRHRGNHAKAAEELGTTRGWMVRAISDYNLRREAPDSQHAFWRAYDR